MPKKMKPARWKELGRKELGLYASGPVAGPGWSNPGYFQMVYEVSEKNEAARPGDHVADQYRTRIEQGPACRYYGEGYDAFHTLYRVYAAHARAHVQAKHKDVYGSCWHKDEVKDGGRKKSLKRA